MNGIESWYLASFCSFNGYSPLTSGSSSRIIRIFSRLSDLPAMKSWTNHLTYIADVVMNTISPTRFFTKYVLRHTCLAIMDSSSLAVSISVLRSSTSTQLRRDPIIVIDAPQSITPSDLSVDSSDWDLIERAIAARAVAVQ
jgi:hypothetical protein